MKEPSAVSYRRYRLRALAALGGQCECCGERRAALLCFDHVSPLRLSSAQRIATGLAHVSIPYRVLKSPNSGEFQVLCLGCNHLKGAKERCPCPDGLPDVPQALAAVGPARGLRTSRRMEPQPRTG